MWHKKNYLSYPFDLADIKRISFWKKGVVVLGSHTDRELMILAEKERYKENTKKGTFSTP